jgi:hypothetical protein
MLLAAQQNLAAPVTSYAHVRVSANRPWSIRRSAEGDSCDDRHAEGR